jgi:acetyl esterase
MKSSYFHSLFVGAALLAAPFISAQGQTGAAPNRQMQFILDALASLEPKPLETLSPEDARKQPGPTDAVKVLIKKHDIKAPEPVGDVDNQSIEGGAGAKVKIRIYTPEGTGPFPVILYVHGGGWVIADLDTYDATPRALCNAVGAIVVSTHYRQAPENKFPAAHDDVYAAYQWVLKNGDVHKGDVSRVAIVGESAGGNMAAATSLLAAKEGAPLPLHQVLVYPVTDVTTMDTPSYKENAMAKPLNKPMMEWFGQHTMNSPEDAKNPRLSLVLADNLKSSPPTTIITAQIDPLRSDGDKLAAALQEAGVPVKLQNYDGVTHEFFGMGAVLDEAKQAVAFAAAELKAAFAKK